MIRQRIDFNKVSPFSYTILTLETTVELSYLYTSN